MKNLKRTSKRLWYFIWEDNSIWSWIVNIVLAFVLIKFVVYPGLGFVLNTSHPVVAVVSESMEHKSSSSCIEEGSFGILKYCVKYNYEICGKFHDKYKSFNLDEFWDKCGDWYKANTEVRKENFKQFHFKNGFNKGDIMILNGKKPESIRLGDVIVFWSNKRDPIIHRVIKKWEENGAYYFQTKGDHNPNSIKSAFLDETKVSEEQVIGNAFFRIPLLGYIKIWFVELLNIFKYILVQKG